MGDPNYIALNNNVNFNTVVETIIKKRCIIDYGIIEAVPANGVVEVAVAVSDTPENMCYLTCVLANLASSSFTVNIKPNVGDRVLVVYPRMYDENMFTVPENDDDKKNVIVNEKAGGYNITSGIAILLNQYKKSSHKNVITFDDGKVDLKLLYDEDNDKYKLTFVTDENGACTVTNEKGTATLGADGYLSYQQKEEGNNTKLTFSDSGFTIKDKAGNSIVSSHGETEDTIVINGNLKVKK